jgi:hypothetical protein
VQAEREKHYKGGKREAYSVGRKARLDGKGGVEQPKG